MSYTFFSLYTYTHCQKFIHFLLWAWGEQVGGRGRCLLATAKAISLYICFTAFAATHLCSVRRKVRNVGESGWLGGWLGGFVGGDAATICSLRFPNPLTPLPPAGLHR